MADCCWPLSRHSKVLAAGSRTYLYVPEGSFMLLLFSLGFPCLENQEMAKEQQILFLAIHLLVTINERSLPVEAT